MSAASTQLREPTDPERRLLALLAEQASDLEPGWHEGLLVSEMDDGGMGSLRLIARGASISEKRRFGTKVAELQFTDADGVEVLVTLNVDTDGQPLELDIWKTDFSPLIKVPDDVRPLRGGGVPDS